MRIKAKFKMRIYLTLHSNHGLLIYVYDIMKDEDTT